MRNYWPELVAWLGAWAFLAVPAALLAGGELVFLLRALIIAMAGLAVGQMVRLLAFCRRLQDRQRQLEGRATQLALAEDLAGFGRWCIAFGAAAQHRWSADMTRILGLSPQSLPDAPTLAALLPNGAVAFEDVLAAHADDRNVFEIEFEIVHPSLGERVLRGRARNGFDAAGRRDQLFMLVRDVSDEYLRAAQAEAERQAIESKLEKALHLARTDPLTGLVNRRAAMSELDRAVMAARNSDKPLSLLTLDIDHFKRINDTHGHLVGDQILARVGALLARQARVGEVVARMGGEEFLWLLPRCNVQGASEAAERVRWAIEAGTALAPVPNVTVSVGHATLKDGDSALTLFARADAAMYEAKRNGRNRVGMAQAA